MDLTNEDVTDILALLDSLPYDELDLQTPRFRLTLRRTPDGWTQSVESRSAPNVLPATPLVSSAPPASRLAGAAATAAAPTRRCSTRPPAAAPAPPVLDAATAAAPAPPVLDAATAAAPATGSMEHRAGYNRPNGASSRLGSDAGGAEWGGRSHWDFIRGDRGWGRRAGREAGGQRG